MSYPNWRWFRVSLNNRHYHEYYQRNAVDVTFSLMNRRCETRAYRNGNHVISDMVLMVDNNIRFWGENDHESLTGVDGVFEQDRGQKVNIASAAYCYFRRRLDNAKSEAQAAGDVALSGALSYDVPYRRFSRNELPDTVSMTSVLREIYFKGMFTTKSIVLHIISYFFFVFDTFSPTDAF